MKDERKPSRVVGSATFKSLLQGSTKERWDWWQARLVEPDTPVSKLNPAQRDVVGSLFCESDRGLVLVTASILDEDIAEFLKSFWKSQTDAPESLMEFFLSRQPLPPLQSTALKIRMARLLGLISEQAMRTGLAIQDIRSKVAAHTRERMVISKQHVASITGHMLPSQRELLNEQLESMSELVPDPVETREKLAFCLAAGAYISMIHGLRVEFDQLVLDGRVVKVIESLRENKDGRPALGPENDPLSPK